MSRQSKRQRQVDAVLDVMRNPPFLCIGTGQGPAPYLVLERPEAPSLCPADVEPVDVMAATFRERFDDKKTAIFCRDFKNAETIIQAIEAVK